MDVLEWPIAELSQGRDVKHVVLMDKSIYEEIQPKTQKILKKSCVKNTTPPSSKYHNALFKVPITLFKVPQHPLQSTTTPSSKQNMLC